MAKPASTDTGHKPILKQLKGMAHYYRPYLLLFWSDTFFAVLGAAVTLVIPLIVRHITSTVVYYPADEALRQILRLTLAMVGLILVGMGCQFFITYFGHLMGAHMEHDMRNEIFGHCQKLSFAFYDDTKVGQLLSRITNDLFEITELLHHGPENLIISLIKIIGAVIILSRINPVLMVVTACITSMMLAFALFMNGRMEQIFVNNRRKISEINEQVEDSLSGIRVVQSFANESVEMQKFSAGNDRYVEAKKANYRFMAIFNSFENAMQTMCTVISIIVGAVCMVRGTMTVADMVTFLLYINNCVEPIMTLVNFTESFQNGYSGYLRFREIMEISPDIEDAPNALPLPAVKGDVRFDHVNFRYGSSPGDVLHDVNLHVAPGEYVALVGSSGAGKTTLCSLIPRFYDVTDGSILVDGKDVRNVKLKDLRDHIGIVQQDVYLFAGTVIDNIRYGRPGATDEECIAAAKLANAHDFISALPQGYYTDIGQRGVKVSGGQKQRISIARVFLKNPPILIFDEATSSLDNESEKVVQDSLEKLAKNRTTFVIAHRLSTIRNAERILVLNDEGIVEEGTHSELITKNGIYAQLYNAQFGIAG